MNALSVNEQMAAILAKTQNWVSFTTAWEETAEAMLEWVKWASRSVGLAELLNNGIGPERMALAAAERIPCVYRGSARAYL